jgi:hypothetical protein
LGGLKASLGRVLTAAAGVCLVASTAQSGSPQANCACRLLGDRAYVDAEVSGLVDAELARLIRLGLEGRIRWQLELVRKRWLIEERVGERVVESTIRYSGDRGTFLINGGGETSDVSNLKLKRISIQAKADLAADRRHELRIRIRLQVVTSASLAHVAAQMVDPSEAGKGQGASLLTRGLVAAVANDLQRDVTATCVAHSEPAR